jgi:hypothetical protein
MNLKPCRSLLLKPAHLPAIAFVGLLASAGLAALHGAGSQ